MARRKSGIRIKPSRRGSLRRITGTPEGKKIPRKTLERLKKSRDSRVRRKAVFALNSRKWSRKRKK